MAAGGIVSGLCGNQPAASDADGGEAQAGCMREA
jgi:hypothetical protein